MLEMVYKFIFTESNVFHKAFHTSGLWEFSLPWGELWGMEETIAGQFPAIWKRETMVCVCVCMWGLLV